MWRLVKKKIREELKDERKVAGKKATESNSESGRARLYKITLKWKNMKERNKIQGIQGSSNCQVNEAKG